MYVPKSVGKESILTKYYSDRTNFESRTVKVIRTEKIWLRRRPDERGSAARLAPASEEAHRDTGSDGRDDGEADRDLTVLGSPVL